LDKKEIINEILKIQQQTNQLILTYAMKSWQELELPLAQLKSLFIIVAKGAINFSALAQELSVTRGNVTGIIDRLEEQGLAVRKSNPEDRRVTWIEATDKGRGLLTTLMESQTSHMIHILEYMSPEELEHLLKGFAGFINALGEYQKGRN
jgi:DNA-binding MarR family transcriptional regulator